MTDTLARPTPGDAASAHPLARPSRDVSIDAVRVVLLVAVFALHAMMVGVSVGPDGPIVRNALEGQDWFGPVSWIVQIMPLFFIAGGFSSLTHWRSMRGRGASAAEYVRARMARLVRPAVALVAVVAVGLVGLSFAGVPAELVSTAGFRIGQPLWFLAVYIAISALVPLMVRAHERAPVLTPLALLGGVVTIDVLRLGTGVEAIGFANLLLVWVLVQQLGFHLADGALDRLRRSTLWGIAAAALVLLAVLTTAGPYPVDMLVNLNPPTVCLVVLGVAQLALFQLARPAIRAWVERADASRLVSAVGERAMTVYLWHLPVLIALAGLLLAGNLLVGLPLPEPLSLEWWATRPLWLGVAAAVVVPVALGFGRFERGRTRGRGQGGVAEVTWRPNGAGRVASGRVVTHVPSAAGAALDAACGAGGVVLLLIAGFGPPAASAALVLLVIALVGSDRLRRAAQTLRRPAPARHPLPL
jgi:fucose 4-O-acetylase-like acetyltransferase